MAALNNVPRKHNKRSTPRSSSSGTARPVREQGGDRRHPAGGNPRLRACSGKPPDGLLHGTVELREALGPELIIHFSAPQVQPAEMASIVDLPRDMSTVGMHGGSGGDARWSLRRALRHGVASSSTARRFPRNSTWTGKLATNVDERGKRYQAPADGAPSFFADGSPPFGACGHRRGPGRCGAAARGASSRERSYRGYLVKLPQGCDVEPIEDWSTCMLSTWWRCADGRRTRSRVARG
jgi:hypothetical protein